MSKNDFDVNFDFEDDFSFDSKQFLGAEDFNTEVDLDSFSDEELGLKDHHQGNAFDMEEEDDFLNMADRMEQEEEEAQWEEEAAYEEKGESPAEEPAYEEEPVYEEEPAYEAPADEEGDMQEESAPVEEERSKRRRRGVHTPTEMPQERGPSIFTKFYDLYFAPAFHKELREEVADLTKSRRRKKRPQQIFKEYYLPPLTVCICVILVLSFVVGSVSNYITVKQIEEETLKNQLDASAGALEQAEAEGDRLLREAERLVTEYNYEAATDLLRSINGGDHTDLPDVAARLAELETIKSQLVEHKEPSLIPNLSFHVLIADLARAMRDVDKLKGNYNQNFVSCDEFSKILQELYNNGFVLVDFDSFVVSNTDLDGTEKFFIEPIRLPEGKKPVMITETMVNYFSYMCDGDADGVADAGGDGFAAKLVIDGMGDIRAEYVNEKGEVQTGNYDLVPILEDFIKEHPDFSYQGARAILAVTGHEGLFGWRCNTSYIATKNQDFYDQEVAGAKKIVEALRDKGYTIASYTYENKDYAKFSVAQISADLQSWTNEVTNIIGPVDTIVFAKNSDLTDYTGQAFNVLYTSGFRYFVGRANSPACEVNTTYVHQKRLTVTGEFMRHYPSQFTDLGLFNPNAVLDMTTRGEVPKAG